MNERMECEIAKLCKMAEDDHTVFINEKNWCPGLMEELLKRDLIYTVPSKHYGATKEIFFKIQNDVY